MSKVKIEGNASGTGTLTITAPNTNTDRSLTLPDGAGEILTDASTLSSSNLSGALPAIDGSSLTGLGTPAFLAYMSAEQSLSDSALTQSALNTTSINEGSGFDTSNYRFSVPSGKAGRYLLHWSPQVQDSQQKTKNVWAIIKVNGTNKFQAQVDHGGNYAQQYATWVSVTGIIDLSVGDLVTFWVAADQTDGTVAALTATWNSTTPSTFAMGYKIG